MVAGQYLGWNRTLYRDYALVQLKSFYSTLACCQATTLGTVGFTPSPTHVAGLFFRLGSVIVASFGNDMSVIAVVATK